MKDEILKKFIFELNQIGEINPKSFFNLQRKFSKANNCGFLQKDELYRVYQKMIDEGIIKKNEQIEKIIRLKSTRSSSGVAVVSVLMKPYECVGNCLYCPTEIGVPKSYLSKEPAVMRAISNGYNPYKQATSRLTALKDTGHITDKISIRIIGGSFGSYTRAYRNWFVRRLFAACNSFSGSGIEKDDSLQKLQEINQHSQTRVVELSIETRQDQIDEDEIKFFRKLGVTKVELGVQSLNNDVLKMNRRNHDVSETTRATKLLKEYGFKISYQMMVNLYGSNLDKDLETFNKLFSESEFKPDHLKIYPLALVKNCDLYELYKEGKFKPYTEKELVDILLKIKRLIPEYCRVERVIRDIPADQIVEGGSKISNLRQIVEKKMGADRCRCIRCREVKSRTIKSKIMYKTYSYESSGGVEYFISAVSDDFLVGFCRLRIDDSKKDIAILNNSSIIREIHVYGPALGISNRSENALQHRGIGKRLVGEAELISKQNGFKKISVIAGVGVRGYFNKLGYRLSETYMHKSIK